MTPLYRRAKLLVCSWALGGDGPSPDEMPCAAGVLDRALQLAREGGVFPGWFWEGLHFADTRVGLRCVGLSDILDWAQMAELSEAPDPASRRARVKINAALAGRLLAGLDVSSADAAAWGRALRAAVRQAAQEFAGVGE